MSAVVLFQSVWQRIAVIRLSVSKFLVFMINFTIFVLSSVNIALTFNIDKIQFDLQYLGRDIFLQLVNALHLTG